MFQPKTVEEELDADQYSEVEHKVPHRRANSNVIDFNEYVEEAEVKAAPASVALMDLCYSYRITQLIYVAAHLGIADLLKDGPKHSLELAQATNAHASSLYRVLRTLASQGIFAEDSEGYFKLTPLAEPLQSNVPGSVRSVALMCGEEWNWRPWGHLLYSVQTGQTAATHLWGRERFEYFAEHPEANAIFNAAMSETSAQFAALVADNYDFSGISTLVDVGGGQGNLLSSILKKFPQMKGILFDRSNVIEDTGTRSLIQAEGVEDRCELASGDFFQAVPGGGDAYILKSVIHNWDTERATLILKNCRQAIVEGGRLLLVEWAIPPGNTPGLAKFIDIQMLVATPGGRTRTEQEYQTLFEATGFRLTRIIPTATGMAIIEGVAV
jgi:hypothetical protein